MYSTNIPIFYFYLLIIGCNTLFSGSNCFSIPDFLSRCTFHIRTDFTLGDASSQLGQILFPGRSNIGIRQERQPPLMLEHINKTMLSMYETRSDNMGVVLSTYQSGISYRRVPSKYTVCTVAQIFSYWLRDIAQEGNLQGDISLQMLLAIRQVIDSQAYPHFILFEDSNLGRNFKPGNLLRFPIIPHISTTAIFVVFNSEHNAAYLVRWVNGNIGFEEDLLGPSMYNVSSTVELIRNWKRLNSNLQRTKIYMKLTYKWHRQEYCSWSPRNHNQFSRIHRFSENDCVKLSFINRHNVSLFPVSYFLPGVSNLYRKRWRALWHSR